jgi:NACalpha-BTF3-like transcription factor
MAEPNPSPASPDEIDPAELQEAEQYHSEANFLKLHRPQFMAMGLPPALTKQVYNKFLHEQFDAVEAFQVELVEDEGFRVVVKQEGGLKAGRDVWILDHLWTTTLTQGPKQLNEIEGLVDRLWTLADMDGHLEEQRAERAANQPAAATPAASTAAATSSAAKPVELDEDALSAIMSEASVSREAAISAYRETGGDLIAAIVALGGESEREKATKAQMEQTLAAQAEQQLAAQGTNANDGLPEDLSELTLEQRIPLLWEGLFRYGLVGSYFTTIQNDVSQSSLKQEDVQTTIYVNDEIGSAFGQANDEANAKAVQAPLVCVTLGGVGFTLLWLTADVEEGEEVLIRARPPIRIPGVPWPKKE